VILPGSTIGVLGGGQLGRMLALEARRMGYRVRVLDPDPACPTAQVADGCVTGALADPAAALALARSADVITLDTEHVPAEVLAALEPHVIVRPGAAVLATIQDRARQKEFLARAGLPQAPFAVFDDEATLIAAVTRLGGKAVLKSRRAGYDGKGQARTQSAGDAVAAWDRIGRAEAVVEAFVPFEKEVSVVLARGVDGAIVFYPLAENLHRHHVLHATRVPADVPDGTEARAQEIAAAVATALGHVGVMAVEMFLLPDGALWVNEIAPRTHNSGHFSFGGCATSQFEQHVRAVCGLALGDPQAFAPVVMINLLGDLWGPSGEAPRWDRVLGRRDCRLHLYGKARAAPGRKMGHLLMIGGDPGENLAHADDLLRALCQLDTAEPRQ
jgi:5-(carboxyamino)imidazole ribonucleotide synthase